MECLGSILVIVRLAPNGCLLNQLKNRENPYEDDTERQVGFTRVDKVRIARDVACGMSHLASKKVVKKLNKEYFHFQSTGLPTDH